MLSILLLSQMALAADGATTCKAIYRTLDEHRNSIEQVVELKSQRIGSVLRHEADLQGKFFSVVEQADGNLLLQITTAPDYTRGSVTAVRPDESGAASLSEVNGVTVHRLECRKSK